MQLLVGYYTDVSMIDDISCVFRNRGKPICLAIICDIQGIYGIFWTTTQQDISHIYPQGFYLGHCLSHYKVSAFEHLFMFILQEASMVVGFHMASQQIFSISCSSTFSLLYPFLHHLILCSSFLWSLSSILHFPFLGKCAPPPQSLISTSPLWLFGLKHIYLKLKG